MNRYVGVPTPDRLRHGDEQTLGALLQRSPGLPSYKPHTLCLSIYS
jgi:hypothetical protein